METPMMSDEELAAAAGIDLAALGEGERVVVIEQMRTRAIEQAAAEREELRVRMLTTPLVDKTEKWRADAVARQERKEAAVAERKAQERRELREQRRHEIELAKAANGSDDEAWLIETLKQMLEALDKMGDVLESLRARVDALDGGTPTKKLN